MASDVESDRDDDGDTAQLLMADGDELDPKTELKAQIQRTSPLKRKRGAHMSGRVQKCTSKCKTVTGLTSRGSIFSKVPTGLLVLLSSARSSNKPG